MLVMRKSCTGAWKDDTWSTLPDDAGVLRFEGKGENVVTTGDKHRNRPRGERLARLIQINPISQTSP